MAEPLMQARDLAKSYGPVVALRSADLVVEPGEVHALLGANGAGKSTLVKILTGVIQADRGTVEVNGERCVSALAGARRRASGSRRCSRTPRSSPTSPIAANLRLTGADPAPCGSELDAMELDVDFGEFVGDVPLPLLRMIDLARALAREPQLLHARRDHGRAAVRPRRARVRRDARPARARAARCCSSRTGSRR